eukprot:304390_1
MNKKPSQTVADGVCSFKYIIMFILIIAVCVFMFIHTDIWKLPTLSDFTITNTNDNNPEKLNLLSKSNLFAHNAEHKRKIAIHTSFIDKIELDIFVPVHAYSWPKLTELLNNGIRGIELDIHPKQNQNDSDFPVYHVSKYDDEVTCNTLLKCMIEISKWMDSSHHQLHPINIELELTFGCDHDEYTNTDLLSEINEIVAKSFDITQLYTPKLHGATPDQLHWPTFENKHDVLKGK